MAHKPLRMLPKALAIACCTCLGIAHAQTDSSTNYLLPSASLLKPGGDWDSSRTGWGGGLKFGMPLSPDWDLQAGVTAARSTHGSSSYNQTLLGVDGLYFLDQGNTRPFLLLGAGAERDRADASGVTAARTSPYANLGLGLQYRWSQNFGMQADVRRVEGFLRNSSTFGFNRSGNTYVNVGLIWSFGSAPASVKPEPVPAPAPVMVAPPPPSAPPAPPAPPVSPPRPPMQKFTLQASELFGFDRATLMSPQARLDEVARVLKANPGIEHIRISGYTDRLGNASYNRKLSQRRADAVMSYLETQGVSASRLQAVGKGSSEPVSSCARKLKRAELIKCLEPDRRVEIEPISYTAAVQR